MENSRAQFRTIYLIGAFATIIVLLGIILDMVTGSITGGNIAALPKTAIGRFNQFRDNPLLGLYNLDLLNIINQIFLIPSIFAIYIAHKKADNGYGLLSLILFLVGTTVFISGNTSLTMFDLSKKYFSAATELQKNLIAAAGEAILAKGEHGGSGVFIGFAIPTFANILISHLMLRGKIFSNVNSYFGLAGSTLMLLYIVLVTFFPAAKNIALIIAMPGGLLIMAWMIMYLIRLLKLAEGKF